MKKVLLCAIATLPLLAGEVFANGFGFANVNVNVGNVAQVKSVQRFGALGLRRNVTKVRSNGFQTQIRSFNTGPLGLLRFNRSNVLVNGGAANVAVFNRGIPRTRINGFRVNAFGTRTVVDGVGNVFEVDAFGRRFFRGNAFGRGFSSFRAVNVGFNHGFGVSVFNNGCFRSFSTCGSVCH